MEGEGEALLSTPDALAVFISEIEKAGLEDNESTTDVTPGTAFFTPGGALFLIPGGAFLATSLESEGSCD